jgi:nicotinate dehydrogenase subunit A
MPNYTLTVNGVAQTVNVDDPATDLLYVLQDYLGLTGPKFGCGLAQCGSCTVLLNGEPVRSCVTPLSKAVGQQIVSIEGLGTLTNPHPIQQAFISQQAMQCGYCISGPMLYGKAFIDQNPGATSDQILTALGKTRLLCRCNAYPRMLAALSLYAQGKTQ